MGSWQRGNVSIHRVPSERVTSGELDKTSYSFKVNAITKPRLKMPSEQKSHKNQKTHFARAEDSPPNWLVFDAKGQILGRFASELAKVLRGKHRVDFTPSADMGDGVIVINAEQVRVTGSKAARKVYRRYTGYMGGLRETSYQTMLERNPTHIVEHAVQGMMPKTRLSKRQLKRLRVFAGTEHDLTAQQPQLVQLKD